MELQIFGRRSSTSAGVEIGFQTSNAGGHVMITCMRLPSSAVYHRWRRVHER